MASALFEKVLACPTLPSLPAVAVEVLRITRDPQARLPEIAMIVQNDPGLSAKILKTVNSSLYGLKERCTRIDRALGFMGMNTVKSIVLGISLVDGTKNVKGGAGFDLNLFWKKTIYGAAAARQIAQITRVSDPDEAFTAGLFQDIGVLAAVTALKEAYIEVYAAVADPASLVDLENEKLGFNHTQLGGELTTRWSLPQQYIDCIKHHHAAQAYEGEFKDIVRVVALGGFIADALGGQLSSKQMSRFRLFAGKWFPGMLDNAEAILTSTSAAAKELAKLFEKSVGDPPDIAGIMAEVQERSMEHQLAVQQEAEQLRQSNHALAEQNFTDTLTKIGNRRKFDSAFADALRDADAATPARPLSLLFVDADKFKSVNDTYGHPAGDAVLIELASRLSDAIGDAGLVCRFGGEEFAILLPDRDAQNAATLAEKVRSVVAATPFDMTDVPGAPKDLKVTISVGVASRQAPGEGPLAGANAERLLKAADEAVYAAKQGGRNCVRVSGADRRMARGNAAPTIAGAMPPADGAGGGRVIRVMVIEDDPLAAALLKACLQRQGKVEVVMAANSDDALGQMKSLASSAQCPAAVVCDHHTGGVDGIEFVRQLHSDPVTAHVPVIITSATSSGLTNEQCVAAGAAAFVSKAELARDLVKWVARIVGEAGVTAKAA